jgi:phage terminase large subunit-like protein
MARRSVRAQTSPQQAGPDGSVRVGPAGTWYDATAGAVAVAFFERLLHHVKGEWSGEPFRLQGWQRTMISELFGWKRQDGTRRYRRAYIEIPRKNGKSTLAAGIGLLLLFADNEPGAEIYSAAADRDQAAIVFDVAKQMVEGSPQLQRLAEVFKRAITVPSAAATYRVLSADAFTKHGLNAHGIVFDELHAQPNRELWDVLSTATGARRQPMLVAITTAGYDRESICWEQHEYARQIIAGLIEDPAFYGYIAAAEETDDWTDPAIWAKANPGLGVSVKLEYLETECRRAQNSPAYQNTFRRLHLNQWTQQETRWLDLAAWDRCGQAVDAAELAGRRCYAGLDLASTTDIAALSLVFPPSEPEEPYQVLPFFWVPAENLVERGRRDRVSYDGWVRQGLITATPGNVIDYETIRTAIERLGERYDIGDVAFDRWGAVQMSQQLEGAGFTMVAMGQGMQSMSPPTKELLRLVLDGRLAHGGNPVLRWMADNLVVQTDPAGNIKPNKAKSTARIDGMVALIMALDRATRHGAAARSVYEGRGLRVL